MIKYVRKVSMIKNKKLSLIIFILLILAAGGWYSFKYLAEQKQVTNIEEREQTQENQNQAEKEESVSIEEKPAISYEIKNLNKKDGSVFSVPDTVSFEISPKVEKTKITLADGGGTVLYFEQSASSSPSYEVYPSGKVVEGSAGFLTIEGFVSGKVVVSKKVKVVF